MLCCAVLCCAVPYRTAPHRTGPDRTGLDWTGLDWTGLDWTGLDWTGLDWTGLDWTGLDWTGLDWTGLHWTEQRRHVRSHGIGDTLQYGMKEYVWHAPMILRTMFSTHNLFLFNLLNFSKKKIRTRSDPDSNIGVTATEVTSMSHKTGVAGSSFTGIIFKSNILFPGIRFCLFGVLRPSQSYFTYKYRDLTSLLADETSEIYTNAENLGHVQWGIFYVPWPIPWRGASVFKVSSEWPVTFVVLLNVKRRKKSLPLFKS